MLNHKKSNKILNKIMLSVMLLSIVGVSNAQLKTAIQVVVDSNKASARAQGRIDKLNDQTDDLTGQYRNFLNEIEGLRVYNKQLEDVVGDQRREIESLNSEMTSLEQTNRGVVPMIIEMVDALGKIVEVDIPFKKAERLKRVENLETLMGDSGITTAERYRKVTEAYGIELDYGSTTEKYSGNLPNGKKVDFLRVGRTSLIYQTLNQEESGWWNAHTGKFEKLDNRYNSDIKEAMRIAAKQASPDLTGLPVFGAKTVGGQ